MSLLEKACFLRAVDFLGLPVAESFLKNMDALTSEAM